MKNRGQFFRSGVWGAVKDTSADSLYTTYSFILVKKPYMLKRGRFAKKL